MSFSLISNVSYRFIPLKFSLNPVRSRTMKRELLVTFVKRYSTLISETNSELSFPINLFKRSYPGCFCVPSFFQKYMLMKLWWTYLSSSLKKLKLPWISSTYLSLTLFKFALIFTFYHFLFLAEGFWMNFLFLIYFDLWIFGKWRT